MKKGYPLIFVVEDNFAYNKMVIHYLKQNNYENVLSFASGEECLQHLYLKPDIIVQDYKLQGISGLHVLKRCKRVLPHTEFIFLSSQESINIAVNIIKHGAFDFIVKDDLAFPQLITRIENICTVQLLKRRSKTHQIFFILLITAIVIIVSGILLYTL